MYEIMKSVSTPLVPSNTSAPTISAASTLAASGLMYERKTVPTLDHFYGKNEDYFSWSEKSMNKLGPSGLAQFFR